MYTKIDALASRLLIPINVKSPTLAPSLCATNDIPHIIAASKRHKGPAKLIFFFSVDLPESRKNPPKGRFSMQILLYYPAFGGGSTAWQKN